MSWLKFNKKVKISDKSFWAKEYDNNGNLKFKGYYLNDEKNGKAKEYIDGKLVFEGQYLKGKKSGKCIEYKYQQIVTFDGIYIEGNKRFGKIKEYDLNNNLIFDGELKFGKREDYGKEYDKNSNIKFDGQYLNGLRNLKGKEFKDGKLIFEGKYQS